jgi:hypothetical protein
MKAFFGRSLAATAACFLLAGCSRYSSEGTLAASGSVGERAVDSSRSEIQFLLGKMPPSDEDFAGFLKFLLAARPRHAEKYPGVGGEFCRIVRDFIPQPLIPDEEDMKRNVLLLRGGKVGSDTHDPDIAYLTCEKGDFSEFIGIQGGLSLSACFVQRSHRCEPEDYLESGKLEKFLERFILPTNLSPYGLRARMNSKELFFSALCPDNAHWPSFDGVIWDNGIALSISLLQPDRPVAARVDFGDTWFAYCKKLEKRLASDHSPRPDLTGLVAQLEAIKTGDENALAQVRAVLKAMPEERYDYPIEMRARLTVAGIDALARAGIPDALNGVQTLLNGDYNRVLSRYEVRFHFPSDGWTALHYAVAYRYRNAAELLIAKKANVNAKDEFGCTPLFWAQTKGMAALLLANKADANARSKDVESSLDLETPLHWAVTGAVAELLVANGADVNARDKSGRTPLRSAIEKRFEDVVAVLLAHGADVSAKGNGGVTPLDYATTKEIAELLLAVKADVNAKDAYGNTPLYYAAGNGLRDVVEVLLANHADVNARGNDGLTPLAAALQESNYAPAELGSSYKEVEDLLRQHGGRK